MTLSEAAAAQSALRGVLDALEANLVDTRALVERMAADVPPPPGTTLVTPEELRERLITGTTFAAHILDGDESKGSPITEFVVAHGQAMRESGVAVAVFITFATEHGFRFTFNLPGADALLLAEDAETEAREALGHEAGRGCGNPIPKPPTAEEERARIVEWLREQAREGGDSALEMTDPEARRAMAGAASTYATAADLITEGAHRS